MHKRYKSYAVIAKSKNAEMTAFIHFYNSDGYFI